MVKRWTGVLVIISFLFLLTGCGTKSVAVVNGEKVSQTELDQRFEQLKAYNEMLGASFEGDAGQQSLAALEREALDSIIQEILIFQAAKKEGVKITDKEIEDFLSEVSQSFGDEEKYQEWLTSLKMTEKDFEHAVKYQLTGQKLFEKVTENVEITDANAKKYYEENKDLWPKQVKVSHILIHVERDNVSQAELDEGKRKAQDIIKQLNNGVNFAELAKNNSEDPGSAAQGGVLDIWFSADDPGLVSEFRDGAFKLTKVGEYSKEPVLSEFGYHIIKLDGLKDSYEDVKTEVKDYLLQNEKNKFFQEYMEKLNKNAEITDNFVSKFAQDAKKTDKKDDSSK